MIKYIIIFFLLAILASFFGFSGLAGTFSQISKIIAVGFIVLFLVSLIKQLFYK